MKRIFQLALLFAASLAWSQSGAPPNYLEPVSNQVIPPPATTPVLRTPAIVGGLSTTVLSYQTIGPSAGYPTQVQDTSYHTALGTPLADLAWFTNCGDPLSAQDNLNDTWLAGSGGSSVFDPINLTSTLMGVSDSSSNEYMTRLLTDPQGHFYCAPPPYYTPGTTTVNTYAPTDAQNCAAAGGASGTPCTQSASIFFVAAGNTVSGGNSSICTSNCNQVTVDFGSPFFDRNDETKYWSFGGNTYDSNPLHGDVFTFGKTAGVFDGSFSYANSSGTITPTYDLTYAFPANYAVEWSSSHGAYNPGDYVIHTLPDSAQTNPEVLQYKQNQLYQAGDIIIPCVNDATSHSCTGFNDNKCAFKATKTGTTGGSAPSKFYTGSNSACSAYNTVPDGGQTWAGLSVGEDSNNGIPWLFQMTGTSASPSASAFRWIAAPSTLATTCSTSVNSTTLTCPSSTFTASMVGQSISVTNACDGSSTCNSSTILYTPITSYTDSAHVVMSTPALAAASSTATVSLTGHPDLMQTVADPNGSGNVWTNLGPAYVPKNGSVWATAGGQATIVSSSHFMVGAGASTQSYGTCAKGGGIYNCGPTQNTGILAFYGDNHDPGNGGNASYFLLNLATGYQTQYKGASGSTLANIISPTIVTQTTPFYAITNPLPTGTHSSPGQGPNCASPLHNPKIMTSGVGMFLTLWTASIYGEINYTGSDVCRGAGFTNFVEWLPEGQNSTYCALPTSDTYDPIVNLQYFGAGLPHFVLTNCNIYALHNGGYLTTGDTSGVLLPAYPYNNASGNNGALPPGSCTGSAPGCPSGSATPILYSGSAPSALLLPPVAVSIGPADTSGYTPAQCTTQNGTGVSGTNPPPFYNSSFQTNGVAECTFGDFSGLACPSGGNFCGTGSGCNVTYNLPPCSVSNVWIDHASGDYNPSPGTTDPNGFVIGLQGGVNQNPTVPTAPWWDEVIMQTMNACRSGNCCVNGSTYNFTTACVPATLGTTYRAGHGFRDANNIQFSANTPEQQVGMDGRTVALPTDMYGQFGSTGPWTYQAMGDTSLEIGINSIAVSGTTVTFTVPSGSNVTTGNMVEIIGAPSADLGTFSVLGGVNAPSCSTTCTFAVKITGGVTCSSSCGTYSILQGYPVYHSSAPVPLGWIPLPYVASLGMPPTIYNFSGKPWLANFTYKGGPTACSGSPCGEFMNPLSSSAAQAGTAGYGVFQAIVGGTTGTTLPAFGASTVYSPSAYALAVSGITETGSGPYTHVATTVATGSNTTGELNQGITNSTENGAPGAAYCPSTCASGTSAPTVAFVGGPYATLCANMNTVCPVTSSTTTTVTFTTTTSVGACASSCGTIWEQGTQIADGSVTWQYVAGPTSATSSNQNVGLLLVTLGPLQSGSLVNAIFQGNIKLKGNVVIQ